MDETTKAFFDNGFNFTVYPAAFTSDSSVNSTSNTTSIAVAKPDFTAVGLTYHYLMGVVISVGVLCNLLALLVFIVSSQLRRTVTGHYLLALALADLIFLIGDFFRWLNTTTVGVDTGVDFMHKVSGVCTTVYFLRYAGKFASAWITMAITMQRFLIVVVPLKVAAFSTTFRIKLIIIVIYILSMALNAFPFWTVDTYKWRDRDICAVVSSSQYASWNTVILGFGSLIIPGVAILILTSVIVYDLVKVGKRRRSALGSARQASMSTSVLTETHLSAMLVAVAVAFVCLRTPYAVMYYVNHYKKKLWSPLDPWLSYRIYAAYKMTDILATVNYAVNFCLYCFCGSTFRDQFYHIFGCRKIPSRQNAYRNRLRTTLTNTSSTRRQEAVPLTGVPLKNNNAQKVCISRDARADTETP